MNGNHEFFIAAADIANLAAVIGFVERCAAWGEIESGKIPGLLIAVEEAFVNVCHYAYPRGTGDVEVTCCFEEDSFVVEIADQGLTFDILSIPDPDTTIAISEREVGGLGVHLIRTLTDEVTSRRENGRNILRIVLRRTRGNDS